MSDVSLHGKRTIFLTVTGKRPSYPFASRVPDMQEIPNLFVVSDSMGETAQLVARAVLSQFPDSGVDTRRFSHVDNMEAATAVVDAARLQPTVIIFTIIIPEVRAFILVEAEKYGVPVVDIMGPALQGVERITGDTALLEPGLIHRLDAKYFRRIEAVEYAVLHDDGKDPQGYRRADVVLLGVSRTSKTPVCMYLANRGIRAANLPLVPEVPPPPELHRVPVQKLVGLKINPQKLLSIRRERVKAMGVKDNSDYAEMPRITQELAYAEEMFNETGCHVVDVSDSAVEETAIVVLDHVKGRS
jgi:regulator of PEP synthase PpsR (kinase-PPPase family)